LDLKFETEESLIEVQNRINYIQKMKKNEELQNEIHFAISRNPFLNTRHTVVSTKLGKYLKIFSCFVLFAGTGLVLNSCMGGYIAVEPSYTEYARPQRLNETQIWINGDWNWNYQTHTYVQKAGYWDQPRRGQSYVEGRWQTTPRGKSWTRGHWQKDVQQKNNRRDNNRQNNNGNR